MLAGLGAGRVSSSHPHVGPSDGPLVPRVHSGEAYDNHGGPALTVDSQGFSMPSITPITIRFATASRNAPMTHPSGRMRSVWRALHYPTLVCGPDDTLYFTAGAASAVIPGGRAVDQEARKRLDRPATIALARFTGYAHFQESLAWGRSSPAALLLSFSREDGPGRLRKAADRRLHGKRRLWQDLATERWFADPRTRNRGNDRCPRVGRRGFQPRASGGAMTADADGRPHSSTA